MNVIYIHTHDTGRFIKPYGYNVPTPNLMEMAREGTLFRNAFCVGPTCSPSRSALLTAMPPHENGMVGLAHRGFGLNNMDDHIVRLLNRHNVETVLCGVQHVVHPDPGIIGYKRIITAVQNETDGAHQNTDISNALQAARYIREKKQRPFFLSFGMINTHRDWPESDINPNYVMPPFPVFDDPGSRKDYSSYLASAGIVDQCVGIVQNALQESGHIDDTFILFTTDHGLAYPNMKCNLYDTGIGVSLIIKYPGNPSKGRAVDALVSHMDLYPTICEILGISGFDSRRGRSIMPLLERSKETIRDEIFAEVNYHAVYEPMRCIRTERYKLIKHYDDAKPIPSNVDGSYVKDLMADAGFFRNKQSRTLLYDLHTDPVERINLAENTEYSDILSDLDTRLDDWMHETKDPLVNGPVPKPEGAFTNKKSCYSPRTEDFE